jgi:hypothetical protein
MDDTQDATRRGTDYETPQHTAGLIAGVDNANENAKDDNKVSQEVEQPKVQRTETEEPVENANPTDSVKVDESEEAMAATTSTERDCEVAENTTGEGGSQGQQRKTQQDGLTIASAEGKRSEQYVVAANTTTGVPVGPLVQPTTTMKGHEDLIGIGKHWPPDEERAGEYHALVGTFISAMRSAIAGVVATHTTSQGNGDDVTTCIFSESEQACECQEERKNFFEQLQFTMTIECVGLPKSQVNRSVLEENDARSARTDDRRTSAQPQNGSKVKSDHDGSSPPKAHFFL